MISADKIISRGWRIYQPSGATLGSWSNFPISRRALARFIVRQPDAIAFRLMIARRRETESYFETSI